MNNIIINLKEDKGAALLYTLIILMLISVVAVSFVSLASTEKIISINEKQSTRAFYLAESGIQKSLKLLEKDEDLDDFSFNIDGDEINVEIFRDNPEEVLIVSNATVVNISRRVVVTLQKSPFSNAIYSFGTGDFESIFSSNCEIFGDSIFNHNVIIEDNCFIDGRLMYYDDIYFNDEEVEFIYSPENIAEAVDKPEKIMENVFDFSFNLDDYHEINDVPVADVNDFSDANGNHFYVDGDVELERNNINLSGATIVVTGSFTVDSVNFHLENVNLMVEGDINFNRNNNNFINSEIKTHGTLTVGDNANSENSLFAAKEGVVIGDRAGGRGVPNASFSTVIVSEGRVEIGNGGAINGSILSESVVLGDRVTVDHDLSVVNEIELIDLYRIIKWSED